MTAGGALDHHPGAVTVAAPPRKAAPGQPWSHQETIALIEAYEEKRGQLKAQQWEEVSSAVKAQQWEEVSSAVAAPCGFDEPPKNGTQCQCRHKVEKLRKRYRGERLRTSPSPSPSLWPYFDRMDRMERGPLPISVRFPPSAAALPRGGGGSNASDDEDEEEEEEEEERAGSNTRSINGILREGNWGFSSASRNSQPLKRTACEMDDDDDIDDDIEEEIPRGRGRGRGGVLSELAAVMRSFGEGLVRTEKRRMKMISEKERDWMEMEAKRAEMVIESQRALVETIAGTFSSIKKAKKSQDK